MNRPDSPDGFVAAAPDHWRPRLLRLRELLLERKELDEAIKWNFPVYSLSGANLLGLFHTKSYVGVWFFQGALLADPAGRLVNASPGKTVAQRQLRFGPEEDVDEELVRAYVEEAVLNQNLGLTTPTAPAAAPEVPLRLQRAMDDDATLAAAYAAFPPYKQREFCESIANAKREETKERRLEKAVGYILEGKGLSDKYRK